MTRSNSTSASDKPSDPAPAPARSRRLWVALGIFVAAILGTLVCSLATLSTPWGRQSLAHVGGRAASAATGFDVRIDGLGPGLPFRLAIERLTVGDADGVWLTADGIDVALSRRALLTAGRLAIDRAGATAIVLARLPADDPDGESAVASEGGFSLPRLPVIHRLELPEIVVAEPVLGEAMTLRADGGVTTRLGDGSQRLTLTVARADSADRFSLTADGAATRWQGELVADLAAFGSLTLQFTADGEPDIAVSFIGEGLLSDRLELPVALGPVALNGSARIDADDRIHIGNFEIAAAGARIATQGLVDLSMDRLDLAISAEVPANMVTAVTSEVVRAETALARAHITGNLTRPEALLSLVLNEAAVDSVSAAQVDAEMRVSSLPNNDQEQRYAFAAEVQTTGARYDLPGVAEILGEAPSLSLSLISNGTASRLSTVTADLQGQRGHASLRDGSLSAGRWRARVLAAIDDFAPLGEMTGLAIRGGMTIDADGAGFLDDGTAEVEVRANLRAFATGEAVIDAALAPNARLTARLRSDAAGEITLSEVIVTGQHFVAQADGRYAPQAETLAARIALKAPDVAPLLAAVNINGGGIARLEAVLDGDIADPDATLTLFLDRAHFDGVTIATARASADVRRPATSPHGRWQLDATTELGRWDASSRFAVTEADAVDVRELRIRGPATEFSGQLTIPLATRPMIGQVKGRFAAPETPVSFGETQVGGQADLVLSLTDDRGQQGANLEIAGRSLVVTQANDPAIRFQRLDARMAGRLEPGAETAAFSISLADPMGHGGQATTNGRLSRVGNAWHLDLTKLAGQIEKRRFGLEKPLNAQIAPGAVALSPFVLRLDGGRLAGDGRWQDDGTLDGRLTATKLPLSLIGLALPAAPSLDGNVDLRLSARNVGTRLVAELGSEIKGGGKGGVPAFHLRTQGRLGSPGLDVTAEGSGPGGSSVNANVQLPLALSTRTFRPVAEIDPPLAGSLQARADLAKLTAALGVDGHAVSGDFAADITIAGTLAAPRPSGGFGVRDLRYENFLTGTILDRGRLEGQLDGHDTLRLTLAADDGGSGKVDATGDLRFGGADTVNASISLRATDAKLLRRDDVSATVSGEVRYLGTAAAGRIDGALTIMPIEAWLVDQLPPSVIVLPVSEIGGDVARRQAELTAGEAPVDWQAALDLTIDMPRRIFVRGRGLESEWAGLLRITGTTAEPRVNGQISLVRGHYDFAGKRFVLTRGIITLFGNDGTDAIVDVAAERRTADLTAIITARGPAQNPEIALTANRDLPESEILSQVLFGKSSARLGPVEAVQLAGAVQALSSGRGVSDDAFSFVRTLLGVDTLSIGADETTGSPTLEAGRYVGDRVFIGGRQGVDPGTGAGTVAVEIAPGITLESELQQGQEEATGTIGLRWRYDY